MPFLGLGVHVMVALFFAVHAVRSGQQTYWLFILFSFPLLGSLVYFLTIYLPSSRLERGARRAASAAVRKLDPTRELRAARDAHDYAPTAQNQMRLAAALLDAGHATEAAQHYETCLRGPFADDLEIRLGAARANLSSGHADKAVTHLEAIKSADPEFRAEEIALLHARALAQAGHQSQARVALMQARERFGSYDTLAECAIWAAENGDDTLLEQVQQEMQRASGRWSRHTREHYRPLTRRVQAALQARHNAQRGQGDPGDPGQGIGQG